MDEFIKKDRRVLKFLCLAVQFFGWALVFGGAVWFIGFVSRAGVASLEAVAAIKCILYAVSAFVFDFFFVGLASVILAQLARYFLQGEGKPGLMLRCAEGILYVFACSGIFWALFRYRCLSIVVAHEPDPQLLYAQALLLPTIAKFVLLIGLAQILKRILPIIEESKTLV
ncbi:MAG TPA: hypothetical protein VMW16_12010 [Sedimentisphaerales bacterium]|nr:hypothetical protein [Sedimentisphaerales bacterium]